MSALRQIYRPSLATLSDLYELTLPAGYAATGHADREAVYTLAFRKLPFGAGYALAGLESRLHDRRTAAVLFARGS